MSALKKSAFSLAIVSLTLQAHTATAGFTPSMMAQPWLPEGATEITLEQWGELLELTQSVPAVNDLLLKAVERAKLPSPGAFYDSLSVCIGENQQAAGITFSGGSSLNFLVPRSGHPIEVAEYLKSQGALDAAIEEVSGAYKVTFTKSNPRICLKAPMTLGNALFIFGHELVHFNQPIDDGKNLIQETYSDNIRFHLLRPGSELDAYRFEEQLKVSMLKDVAWVRSAFRSSFGADLQWKVPREEIARIIMEDQGFTMYPEDISEVYSSNLKQKYELDFEYIKRIEYSLKDANDLIDVCQKNIIILTENIATNEQRVASPWMAVAPQLVVDQFTAAIADARTKLNENQEGLVKAQVHVEKMKKALQYFEPRMCMVVIKN
jgi:hypothetical protein